MSKGTVSTGSLDPNSLTYEWFTEYYTKDVHTGQLGLVWAGTATMTLEVGVRVTPPSGKTEVMKRTVEVEPRRWGRLEERHAKLDTTANISMWGRYDPYLAQSLYSGRERGHGLTPTWSPCPRPPPSRTLRAA